MTIPPNISATPAGLADAALGALAWILADDAKAQRFLDATGLTPDSLRASLGSVATQRAVIDFLCAYEPDLLGASAELGMEPAHLAAFGSANEEGDFS